MAEENNDMKDLKLFDILITFNDSTYLRGSIMEENDTAAYKKFIASPEIADALKVPNRKLLQYTICEKG